MHLKYRNVNDAFRGLVSGIYSDSIPTHVCASRYGEVAMIEEPVIITYERPTERVLFNVERDANPFFHLYESLWMLAGRNDVSPLTYYNKRMREFSDDGAILNDAYGYRWRKAITLDKELVEDGGALGTKLAKGGWPEVDQLSILISHLRKYPESRRAVLQMWNEENDLLKIDVSKAVCCNLSICFSIKDDGRILETVEQGTCKKCKGTGYEQGGKRSDGWYDNGNCIMIPLVKDPETFDRELSDFVELNSKLCHRIVWHEPFLDKVAQPLLHCFHAYKRGEYEHARTWLTKVVSDDWRIVGIQWLKKRIENKVRNGEVVERKVNHVNE